MITATRICLTLTTILAPPLCAAEDSPRGVDGNATIRGGSGEGEIVITTTSRLAGAVHSLTWNGHEFIDSHDHGRQLQSAASFDCGQDQEFRAECFNPTEAGSRRDGTGDLSSSKLLHLRASGNELQSTTQMAFWLAPGEASGGRPALNNTVLSEHRVRKKVRIGYRDLPQVIEYTTTFQVPAEERHRYAQFEALTAYMPMDFRRFEAFDPRTRELIALTDGPGEQSLPIVFSTDNGSHAMGVYSPDQPSPDFEQAGYGRFRFPVEQVVKWNCVFRQKNPAGISAGDYTFRMFVAVGTREDVRLSLNSLITEFERP